MKLTKTRELLAHGMAFRGLDGCLGLELILFAVIASFKNPELCCHGGLVLPAE